MLELSIVLAVVGVLLVVAMNYRNANQDRPSENSADFQNQIIAAVYGFAARNYRLPCADTDGDGYEGVGSPGSCTTTDSNYMVGGVPFKTLGLETPTIFGNGFEKQFIYGVYRNTAIDADLARIVERTGDAAGDSGYLQLNDFKKGLRNAGAVLTIAADAGRIHVTGDGVATGAINCASNRVVNVALFVVHSGSRNADASGGLFDGANGPLAWPGGGSTCVASPNTPKTAQYDDTVRAIGYAELLGYVSR